MWTSPSTPMWTSADAQVFRESLGRHRRRPRNRSPTSATTAPGGGKAAHRRHRRPRATWRFSDEAAPHRRGLARSSDCCSSPSPAWWAVACYLDRHQSGRAELRLDRRRRADRARPPRRRGEPARRPARAGAGRGPDEPADRPAPFRRARRRRRGRTARSATTTRVPGHRLAPTLDSAATESSADETYARTSRDQDERNRIGGPFRPGRAATAGPGLTPYAGLARAGCVRCAGRSRHDRRACGHRRTAASRPDRRPPRPRTRGRLRAPPRPQARPGRRAPAPESPVLDGGDRRADPGRHASPWWPARPTEDVRDQIQLAGAWVEQRVRVVETLAEAEPADAVIVADLVAGGADEVRGEIESLAKHLEPRVAWSRVAVAAAPFLAGGAGRGTGPAGHALRRRQRPRAAQHAAACGSTGCGSPRPSADLAERMAPLCAHQQRPAHLGHAHRLQRRRRGRDLPRRGGALRRRSRPRSRLWLLPALAAAPVAAFFRDPERDVPDDPPSDRRRQRRQGARRRAHARRPPRRRRSSCGSPSSCPCSTCTSTGRRSPVGWWTTSSSTAASPRR